MLNGTRRSRQNIYFMFSKNVLNFLKLLVDKEGQINLNMEDDIIAATTITHQGEINSERLKK